MIDELLDSGVTEDELKKVKNQAESSMVFGEVELLQRAMNLAFHTLNGDTEEINREAGKVQAVRMSEILDAAKSCLRKTNCSALHYYMHHEN